jgi:hypothetical protein
LPVYIYIPIFTHIDTHIDIYTHKYIYPYIYIYLPSLHCVLLQAPGIVTNDRLLYKVHQRNSNHKRYPISDHLCSTLSALRTTARTWNCDKRPIAKQSAPKVLKPQTLPDYLCSPPCLHRSFLHAPGKVVVNHLLPCLLGTCYNQHPSIATPRAYRLLRSRSAPPARECKHAHMMTHTHMHARLHLKSRKAIA